MAIARARMMVLSVGQLVQVSVHGATFVITSTEAWDLGGMLRAAASACDEQHEDSPPPTMPPLATG